MFFDFSAVKSFRFKNHLSSGVLTGMRDGEMDPICAQGCQQSFRLTTYFKTRHTHFVVIDFYVVPGNFSAPTRFQSLQECLLGGKTPGVGLSGSGSFLITVLSFSVCENPLDKTRCSFDSFANAINFYNVYTNR